jgi:hypothetical protein
MDEIDAQFIAARFKPDREKNRILPGYQVDRGVYNEGFLLLKTFYLIDGHLHEGILHGTAAVQVDHYPVILVPGITDFRRDATGK